MKGKKKREKDVDVKGQTRR